MFRAHVLIIRRSKLHYTVSGIITPLVVLPALGYHITKSQLHYTVSGIITPLVVLPALGYHITKSQLHYTVSGIITPIGGRLVYNFLILKLVVHEATWI